MEELQSNYYAILPADVRYDPDLIPNAKLLYAEITALSNKTGYCWATNEYFARIYSTSKVSIIKWINQLEEKGYIEREIIYRDDTKEIQSRCIRLKTTPSKENLTTPGKEMLTTPGKEKFTQNNKLINNKIINNNIYNVVLDYLNEKAGTHYRPTTNATQRHISARIREGYTEEDFKTVIDKKVAEWKGTEWEQYLRPETLFGQKFEGYLNAQIKKNPGKKPIAREYSKEDLDSLFTNLDGEITL